MRRLLILLLNALLVSELYGQVVQGERFELVRKNADPEPIVFSLDQEGLIVIEDSREFEGRKRIRKYIQLDTALHIVWASQATIPEEEELAGYEYTRGNFQILYTHRQHEHFKGTLVNLDLKNKSLEADPFNVQLGMKLTHFTAAGKNSVIGGQVGLQPMIALFDRQTKRTQILPGFFLSESELIDVRANTNETFSILQMQKKGREKTITYRAFDPDGNQLVEDRFSLDPEITVQSAMVSTFYHEEVLIAGIYSYGNSRLSSGIFTVLLNPSEEKKVTYTDFPKLTRFLDYLPEKKSERIIRRANQRRAYGRSPDFRIAASLHRLDEYPFGFLIFGESFQIPNNSQSTLMSMGPYFYRPGLSTVPYQYSNMPWRYGYDPFATSARVIGEVRMTNAFAVAFDLRGNYLWDESVDLNQSSIPPDVQYADYVTTGNRTEFLFPGEKGLGYSEPIPELKKKKAAFQSIALGEGQGLIFETGLEHTVRKWYGPHLFIYGAQTIRDGRFSVDEQKRKIFFINKISLKTTSGAR